MIEGINPLHITEIYVKKFRRYGVHPMIFRLARKRGFFSHWHIRGKYADSFDEVFPAQVVIEGQTRVLKRIDCQSNHEAEEICEKLQSQMADFFGELNVLEKLRNDIR